MCFLFEIQASARSLRIHRSGIFLFPLRPSLVVQGWRIIVPRVMFLEASQDLRRSLSNLDKLTLRERRNRMSSNGWADPADPTRALRAVRRSLSNLDKLTLRERGGLWRVQVMRGEGIVGASQYRINIHRACFLHSFDRQVKSTRTYQICFNFEIWVPSRESAFGCPELRF